MAGSPAGGAPANNITLVQHIAGGFKACTGTPTSCSLTATVVTAGNTLLAWCNAENALSIADTNGGTPDTFDAVGWANTGTSIHWNAWVVKSAVGGSTTITCSAAAGQIDIDAVEISGLDTTNTVDQQNSTATLDASYTSPAITTLYTNEIIFSMLVAGNGSTAPSSLTVCGTAGTFIGGSNQGGINPGWGYRIVTGTQTGCTAVFASPGGNMGAQIVSLRGAGQ